MLRRPFRRAVGLSLGVLLLFAGTAAADSVQADNVTPVVNGSHFLGDVTPGGIVSADVSFLVVCAGLQHIDANQSVVLTGDGGNEPSDGAIVSVSTVTLTKLSIPWGPDSQGCPDPVPSYAGGVLSHVVLRAPTTTGTHTFAVQWTRSLTPEGVNDANAFGRTPTSIAFSVRVVAGPTPVPNTPPVLTVPASFEVEGDATGSWLSTWTVSATDAEDEPDPTPTCSPAAGTVLHLGTTTITCTAQDSAGATDTDTFNVTVAAGTPPPNTPPVLTVPASFEVEGDTTGGWGSAWTISATDAEDVPDPTPTCSPAAGGILPLGRTTVTCTVQDSAGATDTESFEVKVVDTTAPTLGPLPDDIRVTTSDPTGRTVTFTTPTASDVVDESPSVTCAPTNGDHFDVGRTPVTCTAADSEGNSRAATFFVTVVYQPPPAAHTASAVWLEPVGGESSTFAANRGRTIPVKVNLYVDDRERSSGDAVLTLTPCGGGTQLHLPLDWSGGRWNAALDTSWLSASCYIVTASIDGLTAGSFTLELRGDEAPKAASKRSAPAVPTLTSAVRSSNARAKITR
jgi:hypothetical protein